MGARIGIVGGNGWIGGAIAGAVVAAGLVTPRNLTLFCRSDPPGWLSAAHWTHDNQALADRSDIVVLSVRPEDWPSIRIAAPRKLVISVKRNIRAGSATGTDPPARSAMTFRSR